MNFVFLSPHFPPNYYQFCKNLNSLGVTVLGLADEPYPLLNPELRDTLTEYYLVDNMHNYQELLRACGFFTYQYGKIDRIDSLNEYWLEFESRLRSDFNIPGVKEDEIMDIKRKSLMKKKFIKAGVPVAEGRLVKNFMDAKRLIKDIGLPVVAKPDIGVGAAKTYKINSSFQLESFFSNKPDLDYLIESYIEGDIVTFDGLTDQDGNLVFFTSHQYSRGIMDIVNNDDNVFYYSLREIPAELENIGRKVLRVFDVKERFFHFEFFYNQENQSYIALEVNMRPPGGLTTDMFNYANDIDIYKEWAHVIVHNTFTANYTRPYHCCYIGRKGNREYLHSHDDILNNMNEGILTHHQPISGVFSAALGDYGYLVRSPHLEEIFEIVAFIQDLK